MELVKFLMANGWDLLAALGAVILALVVLLKAVVAVALLIPGDQPEKALGAIVAKLEKVVALVKKYSRKPVELPKAE